MSENTNSFIQKKSNGINIKATFEKKITFLVEGGNDKEFFFKHINKIIPARKFVMTPCQGKDRAIKEYGKFNTTNHGRNKGNVFLIIDRDFNSNFYHLNCDNIDQCRNCHKIQHYNTELNCHNTFVTTGYSFENKIFHPDNLEIYFNYKFGNECEEHKHRFLRAFNNFLNNIKDYIILYQFLTVNNTGDNIIKNIKEEIRKVQYPYTYQIKIKNADNFLNSKSFLQFKEAFQHNNRILYNEFNGKELNSLLQKYIAHYCKTNIKINYNNLQPLSRFNKFIKNISDTIVKT